MNLKSSCLGLVCFISFTVFADSQFVCEALNVNTRERASGKLEISRPGHIHFEVANLDIELNYEKLDNALTGSFSKKNHKGYVYYGKQNTDGYGGFEQIAIPAAVMTGNSSDAFVVYYLAHSYSEAGHVDTIDIKATCY